MRFTQHLLSPSLTPKHTPRSDPFLLTLTLQIMARSQGEPPPEKLALLDCLSRSLPPSIAPSPSLLQQTKALLEHHAASFLAASHRVNLDDIPEPEQPSVILQILLPLIDLLSSIQAPQNRPRCLLLALEMACVRGFIDEQDDTLLLHLSNTLSIDRILAQQLTEFTLLKYLPSPMTL